MAAITQHDTLELVHFITFLRLVAVLQADGTPLLDAQQHAYVEVYGPDPLDSEHVH